MKNLEGTLIAQQCIQTFSICIICIFILNRASTLGKVAMLKWGADVGGRGLPGGRGLSLLCPLGWVNWDWDGLSWMRVEMGWGWGWVELG